MVSPEPSAKTETVSDDDQAYNSAGQVTGTTFQLGQSTESNSYTYDADGQLLSSSGASDDTYGYDPNGNRDTTGYTVGTGNELTNSPGVTYTYDNDGGGNRDAISIDGDVPVWYERRHAKNSEGSSWGIRLSRPEPIGREDAHVPQGRRFRGVRARHG